MRIPPTTDQTGAMQDLVHTMLDVFDAARDLHQTLSIKEQRDHELRLRAKGYPSSRGIEFVKDSDVSGEEAIMMDKTALKRQFETGLREIGPQFAIGDALSHIALQSQIIALQGILLTTFLYGPTSPDPVSQQLSKLDVASRAAGVASVDILAAQQQRQQAAQQQAPRSAHPSAARSVHSQGTYRMDPYNTNTVSSALVTYEKPSRARSGSPVNTTVLDRHTGIQSTGSHIDNSSFASTTSYGTEVASPGLYCPYAKDLDRYRSQPLSSSITSGATPHCPQCKRTLHLSPGRAWEVYKNSDGCERRFQVSNRFAVKCHRPGPDAGYACILCSRSGSSEAICGDVKALIQHVWQDHKVSELKAEEDITEVIDLPIGRRRDSVPGYSTSRSSGRSASLGSRRRRSRYDVEHEVEAFDMRHSRRAA